MRHAGLWGLILCLIAGCGDSPDELVSRLRTRDRQELREVMGELVRLPNAIAVPALRRGLHADKWRTRYMSAQLLGRFRDEAAIPELVQTLSDSIDGVRAQAATALGLLQAQEAVTPLIDALQDVDVVRIAAAGALGQLGASQALPALSGLAQDPTIQVRAAAISALGACIDTVTAAGASDHALHEIERALVSPLPRIRIAGLVALQALNYHGRIGTLLRLVRDPSDEVQHVAVQALGEIDGPGHAVWAGHPTPDMSLVRAALDSVVVATDHEAIRARARQSLARIDAL